MALTAMLTLGTTFAQGKIVSKVDTTMKGSEKYLLRVDGKPFYMTNVQIRLDKLSGYEGWNDAALERVVKQAAEDGFNTVSIPVVWREVEPEKDKFSWTTLDRYLGWCHKYGLKMELLWFSWSSGGRIQWLVRNKNVPREKWTLRTPDYVCSQQGTSSYKVVRKTDPWTLDWKDPSLRRRDKYVLGKVMEHVAQWDKQHGNPHTVIGVQLGNEVLGHEYELSAEEAVDYCSYIGAAVKESDYQVWTRMNCVSWMTKGRIEANEKKRLNGGTNVDFVGIDIYGTNAESILGDMKGQLPQIGTNFPMIMEIDAKDPRTPFYQMAALASGKYFDYYNYAVVDGNELYERGDNMTLKERPQIRYVRQRNKIFNMANTDLATKAHGKSMYVYNRKGLQHVANEMGIAGIAYTATDTCSQAVAIFHAPKQYVLLSTGNGRFSLPGNMKIKTASSGFFDKKGKWVKQGNVTFDNGVITMPQASAVLVILEKDLK